MTTDNHNPPTNNSVRTAFRSLFASRSTIWLLLALIALVCAAGLGWRWQRGQREYPGTSTPVAFAADKSLGVTADLARLSPEERGAALDGMAGLRLKWVRQPFPWREIEPAPGSFEWTKWDEIVTAVAEHDLSLIAVLDSTPDWAHPLGDSPNGPPQELADFGRFAGAFATRYSGQIGAYQVWHEPNLSAHWGDAYVDPSAYAGMLREAAVNIRGADNGTVIVSAALAPTVENGPLNLNEMEFLSRLYAANAGPWFDVVAAEPYGFAASPSEAGDVGRLDFQRAALMRLVMEANGDTGKAIWLTAFGWSVATNTESPWPAVGGAQQEAYTRQAIDLARARWPWLGPMLFPVWDAALLAADDPRSGLAVVDGGTPLPPAVALNAATAVPVAATVGVYSADHPSATYEGDWRVADGRADVPVSGPARLTIRFEGTRLDLDVQRGAFKGFLYVTVDGQPANALPWQDGRAYLVLFDPLQEDATVPLARNLTDGPHTAVLEAEGGWYQWAIRGWRVSRETSAPWMPAALMGLLLVSLASAFLWVWKTNWASVRPGLREVDDAVERVDWRLHLALTTVVAVVFFLAPGTALSALLAVPLFLLVVMRPAHGLLLMAFSLPFFLIPKYLAGRSISMTEVLLLLVAVAVVVRRVGTCLGGTPRRWDWLAWFLTGIGLLCALLTVAPASLPILGAADLATTTLVLLPLAGVAAALAQHRVIGVPAGTVFGGVVKQLDLGVLALVGLGLASSLAADNPGVAFHEFHVVILDATAFYALIRLLPRQRNEKPAESANDIWHFCNWLVFSFLAGASLMAGYALYQYIFTENIINAEGVRRTLGVYGSPNNLALFLERATPVVVSLAAFSGARQGRRWPAILAWLALGINLLALVLTFSRGALLVGLPAALLFLLLMRGRRWLAWGLAGLVAAGGGILPVLGTERLRSLLNTGSGTGFFRLRLWQSAVTMLRDHPLLGVGPDNFLYQYRTRYILPDAWQEPNLSHPHNILLDFGTRLGVGGIALLVWMLISFFRLAAESYRRLAAGPNRALILGLMGSVVATLAHGLVDNSVFLVDLAFVFLMTFGVVADVAELQTASART